MMAMVTWVLRRTKVIRKVKISFFLVTLSVGFLLKD